MRNSIVFVILATITTLGCASSSGSSGSPNTDNSVDAGDGSNEVIDAGYNDARSEASVVDAARPISCNPTLLSGIYRFDATIVSGNCGVGGSDIVTITPGQDAGCQTLGSSLSADRCTSKVCIECPSQYYNRPDKTCMTLRQVTQDGSIFTGEMITTIASRSCFGTYQVTYTRM
jgi:hypothetical protein